MVKGGSKTQHKPLRGATAAIAVSDSTGGSLYGATLNQSNESNVSVVGRAIARVSSLGPLGTSFPRATARRSEVPEKQHGHEAEPPAVGADPKCKSKNNKSNKAKAKARAVKARALRAKND